MMANKEVNYKLVAEKTPHLENTNNIMIQIYRKEGWVLNPNDKVVNGIFKMVERNNGECPCHNDSEDKHCPCSSYRLEDVCHCNLYVKIEK